MGAVCSTSAVLKWLQVAARNQGALGSQLQALLQRLRLSGRTLQALQACDLSSAGCASSAAQSCSLWCSPL